MPKSIKDIKKNSQSNKAVNTPNGRPVENESDVAELINHYSGKSDNELMNELLEVTSWQRRNGMLDSAQIDAAASAILPMLNEEQTRKLQTILKQIR